MYVDKTILGERGQIVIPKPIRQMLALKKKDVMIVKVKTCGIYLEKEQELSKKSKEKLMAQAYKERAKQSLEICDDWKHVDKETDDLLGDY
jgi:bifunctional DNA-binding transcriptional regulator/antitoxin component of YhaV-PrlF toxin-antitoxin module